MLKYILLGFLNYCPMTGYDLKSVMERSTLHFWHAYHSQIYTALRKLEEDGLVTSLVQDGEDALNRRVYTISEAGREDFLRWLNAPLTELPPVKENFLVRVFFSGKRSPEDFLNELRFQRQLHQQNLEHYKHIEAEEFSHKVEKFPEAYQEAPFWMMTLRFGIQFEEMYLQWLDGIIATLQAK